MEMSGQVQKVRDRPEPLLETMRSEVICPFNVTSAEAICKPLGSFVVP